MVTHGELGWVVLLCSLSQVEYFRRGFSIAAFLKQRLQNSLIGGIRAKKISEFFVFLLPRDG